MKRLIVAAAVLAASLGVHSCASTASARSTLRLDVESLADGEFALCGVEIALAASGATFDAAIGEMMLLMNGAILGPGVIEAAREELGVTISPGSFFDEMGGPQTSFSAKKATIDGTKCYVYSYDWIAASDREAVIVLAPGRGSGCFVRFQTVLDGAVQAEVEIELEYELPMFLMAK
jgi:hypothetical protein